MEHLLNYFVKKNKERPFLCPLPLISYSLKIWNPNTAWKVSKYGVISGLSFPVFGLNKEIYKVNLKFDNWNFDKIQSPLIG